jgi:hypothetical protein
MKGISKIPGQSGETVTNFLLLALAIAYKALNILKSHAKKIRNNQCPAPH